MKQFTLKSLMLLLLLLIGGGSYAWGETKTGTWDLTKESAALCTVMQAGGADVMLARSEEHTS